MPAKRVGVWIGVSERVEEVLIGIEAGVMKCRIAERLGDTGRWNRDNVLGMVGVPWEPFPWKCDQHIPVDITEDGEHVGSESARGEQQPAQLDDDLDEQGYIRAIDKFHVSRKAINKFGETNGCAACPAIRARRDRPDRDECG